MTETGPALVDSFDDVDDDDGLSGSEVFSSELGNRPAEDLGFTAPAQMVSGDQARRLSEARADKAHQQNHLRQRYFEWSRLVVGGCLVGNFLLFGFYMRSEWKEISDAVMMAWISATVVEVLGIAYIIAKYLFEGDGPN